MAVMALLLSLCACGGENWRPSTGDISGSFAQRELTPGVWHLAHRGDRWQSRETVQTFWLFRAAELALAQGQDGFAILSESVLADTGQPSPDAPVMVAATTLIPIMIPLGGSSPPAQIEVVGDIRLVKGPVTARPPHLFDAHRLRQALAPHVTGPRCTGENICPHRQTYLSEP